MKPAVKYQIPLRLAYCSDGLSIIIASLMNVPPVTAFLVDLCLCPYLQSTPRLQDSGLGPINFLQVLEVSQPAAEGLYRLRYRPPGKALAYTE